MGPKEKQDVAVKAYLDGVPVSIGEITLDEITPVQTYPDSMVKYYYNSQDIQKAAINGYDACTNRYTPGRILKSGNRTIVFWLDGTKTIVKRAEGEPDDAYSAFTAALGIKLFGSNSALKKMLERKTTVQESRKEKKNG